MRYDRLDLNLLAALDVLIETRSVSEAARRLNLSQPAVTGALNRLRDFFKDDLLVLNGRQMLLTHRAEELAEPVRRSLMLIRAEITRPGGFDPATSQRRFAIVASDYAFTVVLADIVKKVAQVAPHISFEIIPPGSQSSDRLERAEIDLLFTVEPLILPHQPSRALWRDDEVVISWEGAGYPGIIDMDDFYRAGYAVTLFGSDRRPTLTDAHLQKAHPGEAPALLLPNFSALPLAIAGTGRMAIMHRLFAEHFALAHPIRLHQPSLALPEIVEVVQWNHVRERDPGIRWLLEAIQAQVNLLPTRTHIG
ncbi:LysR family transcriptional regulator [Sphingobium sp. HWE2-09]|uniref:LysR family transcriptional regulator n=1 Tax=Sphingobium sp. HWE2-09 TaxID=3108390 RepID=UPI002DC20294|nr:LysR family transcriptional regulator [Sphingobium sp. HWE2-09]